jgi:hypothetical protein
VTQCLLVVALGKGHQEHVRPGDADGGRGVATQERRHAAGEQGAALAARQAGLGLEGEAHHDVGPVEVDAEERRPPLEYRRLTPAVEQVGEEVFPGLPLGLRLAPFGDHQEGDQHGALLHHLDVDGADRAAQLHDGQIPHELLVRLERADEQAMGKAGVGCGGNDHGALGLIPGHGGDLGRVRALDQRGGVDPGRSGGGGHLAPGGEEDHRLAHQVGEQPHGLGHVGAPQGGIGETLVHFGDLLEQPALAVDDQRPAVELGVEGGLANGQGGQASERLGHAELLVGVDVLVLFVVDVDNADGLTGEHEGDAQHVPHAPLPHGALDGPGVVAGVGDEHRGPGGDDLLGEPVRPRHQLLDAVVDVGRAAVAHLAIEETVVAPDVGGEAVHVEELAHPATDQAEQLLELLRFGHRGGRHRHLLEGAQDLR